MIDVLVPILGRPPQAMLRSLKYATSTPFEVFFLCSPGDTEQIAACEQTGCRTEVVPWEPGRGDYAKKINWGFINTEQPWFFNGADDIRFSPGWDTTALALAEETGAPVIGTNDLHNPAVLQKRHATHMLISRQYVLDGGGTFDGTGAVFSEVYDHQFIDNEFVAQARKRNSWAFAEDAVVEHLHPVWGLAEWDQTYEKAFRDTRGDQRLFAKRVRMAQRS